ncbi:hypothetical protein [Petrimonas sp.]|uniref:hypothetical protein n=1 Tax=Petrimonas sp. TaxID=2023866 RepID=UPI003F50E360
MSIISGINKTRVSMFIIETFLKINSLKMAIRNTHSILFNVPKMIFPMFKPMDVVTPAARNFSQDSMKLIAHTNPIQIKAATMDKGYFIVKLL